METVPVKDRIEYTVSLVSDFAKTTEATCNAFIPWFNRSYKKVSKHIML